MEDRIRGQGQKTGIQDEKKAGIQDGHGERRKRRAYRTGTEGEASAGSLWAQRANGAEEAVSMEQMIFKERIEGLVEAEQVIREQEYSMTSRHFHDTYELYYLKEGERYYFIDKETYLVGAGDVVLVKPNQIHKTSMAKTSYHNRILLQIQEGALDAFLRGCGLLGLRELYERYAPIISLRESDRETVEGLLFQIRDEIRDKKSNYELMVKMKLQELLIRLSRYRRNVLYEKNQSVQNPKYQKVHEVADYLQTHPETRENLEELADRIFKEVTGFGINEYTNIIRIKKAQGMLIHGKYSVTEISELLGFESITYFERVFKKYTASTPLKYRRGKQ